MEKGWAEQQEGGHYWTPTGQFLSERVLDMSFVASYTSMLTQMDVLLFGDSTRIFQCDSHGYALSADRALNVITSSFQREKYFAAVDDTIQMVFNQHPVETQPRYIADMGGDAGALLKRIYHVIETQTLRGQKLADYPLTLVGVDYNEASL